MSYNNIHISLDSSVRHITRVAAMALSGNLQTGISFTCNPSANIVIYKDRIEFGRCLDSQAASGAGLIMANFYMEYGNIVYRFGSNIKCSFLNKTIDYIGCFPPTLPDNQELFNMIYPRFA